MTSNLSIERLNGVNFYNWKFKVQMLLIREDLWEIVNGSDTAPVGTSEAQAIATWRKRDQKALSTICLAIEDSELTHVRACKTAAEAWKNLGEAYETKGLARKLYLRRKFLTHMMIEGDTMQEHITRLSEMAEQLEAIGAEVSDGDMVMTLLCSLPSSYEMLIVSLETRSEDLTASFVKTRLLQEEVR